MNELDDPDDRLRSLLRAGDPARDLPPSDPTGVRRRAGRISSSAPADRSPAPSPRRPHRRRVGLVAGGVTLAAAAGVAAVLVGTGGGPGTATVTALTVPAAADPATSMCATLTPEGLRQNATAFEARVTGVEGGTVTMEVVRRFKGEVEDEVTVPQQTADVPSDFSAVPFQDGRSYLVSTVDGTRVTACGQSGPVSPELQALYERAFAG